MISSNLKQQIQEAICKEILVKETKDSSFTVDIPLWYPDGDRCRLYVEKDDNEWIISDGGVSIMRAAYADNVNVTSKPYRDRFNKILEAYKLTEAEGELVAESGEDLGNSVFLLAQASIDVIHLARCGPKFLGGDAPFVARPWYAVSENAALEDGWEENPAVPLGERQG